jgi:hypothetical protein
MNTWKEIKSDNIGSWYTCEDLTTYLKVFTWLVTSKLNELKSLTEEDKFISGLGNTTTKFEYDIPNNPTNEIIENRYWSNYTWICITYIDSHLGSCYSSDNQNYYHFRMINDKEYKYPPIPKFLIEFYYSYHQEEK